MVGADTGKVEMGGLTLTNFHDFNRAQHIYLFKLDSSGKALWGKSVRSSGGWLEAVGVAQGAVAVSTNDNSIILAGDFSGSLDLTNPAIPALGQMDVFVAKIAGDGVVLWVRTMGGAEGTGNKTVNASIVDGAGNIYTAGTFSESMAIGGTLLQSHGLLDIFLVKHDPAGNLLWVKQLGWIGTDYGVSLTLSPDGELVVVGTASGGLLAEGTYHEGPRGMNAFVIRYHAEDKPPKFVLDPQSQVVREGAAFTLRVELAVNDPATQFQWWFKDAPMPGQTKPTLTVANANPDTVGGYHVVATNPSGLATSATATITLSDTSSVLLILSPSLTISGEVGLTYRIDYSTTEEGSDQWTTATNLTLATSPTVWVDPTAKPGEQRLYRVMKAQ